ncbi:MAG: PilZ domain-containing protein [Candidatus Omnitrophota bacterium]
MDEKREFVRFRVSFPFGFGQDEIPSEIKATVKNISMSGLKVVFDESLHLLAEGLTKFHLILPDNKTLDFSGEVIWQKDFPDRKEAGIRFEYISDSHKEDIYDYIFKYHRQELTQKWWQM